MEKPSATEANDKVVLDTRGLEPPQPVLAVLRKVSEIPRTATLEVRLDSNPFQLYDLLQQRGFQLSIAPNEEGGFLGQIRPRKVVLH